MVGTAATPHHITYHGSGVAVFFASSLIEVFIDATVQTTVACCHILMVLKTEIQLESLLQSQLHNLFIAIHCSIVQWRAHIVILTVGISTVQ